MARYYIEGEWTGYTSAQRRVVHREVVSTERANRLRKLHAIVYTDGTSLLISLHEAKPREKIAEIKVYSSLIREAEWVGKPRVLVSEVGDAA